jgi:hypothetical protein
MGPKPSPNGLVLGAFGPTLLPSGVIKCTPKPPPPLHPPLPIRPPPLPSSAVSNSTPQIKPWWLNFGFWPKSLPLHLRRQTAVPTTTTNMSPSTPNQTTPLSSTTVSNGTPEIVPWWLDFGFLAQKPTSLLVSPDSRPSHQHLTYHSQSSHSIALQHHFQWHA